MDKNSVALWMVKFTDGPEMLNHRKKHGSAHLEFLEENRDKILLAGGLRFQMASDFVGGMWIVKAGSKSIVENLVKSDPYYVPDHRHFAIFYWGPALPRMSEIILTNDNRIEESPIDGNLSH